MMNKLGAIFSIIFGSVFIIFSKSMARYAVNAWVKRFDNFMKPSEVGYRVSFLLGGAFFVIMGVLALIGVIRFK